MNISDIYAGKPDASDEIRERGYEEFACNYIQPTGISIEKLASTTYGTPFFIMGDKGTGKTALLHFLVNYVRTIDEAACSSFIYFESGFSQVQKTKFEAISHSISTSISIDTTIATEGKNIESDFAYIWRWQLYQKIITDNEIFNGGLFVDDNNWSNFKNQIAKISKTIEKEKMFIPAKATIMATSNPQQGTITSGLQIEPIDFSQSNFNSTKGYNEFVKIIDDADRIARTLCRTDIPYYIFIDELEAYRGENEIFYRDLRMIRDLLFTVKNMNDMFQNGTKIICSVRLEILNAINRFVQSNQLHKIMQGYDERLIWEHTNTNSFRHPIINVLLRRIQIAEEKQQGHSVSNEEIIKKWFVTNVYNTHICTYILDHTWHKPRDIVRLLLSAQVKNSKNQHTFNQYVFETFMPVYSKQCLVEVREEMRALYTAEEIEQIFNCMQGYKSVFSYQEIVDRARCLYPHSVLAQEPYTVLCDMYRIGVIGNVLNNNCSPRWEYKEQYKLLIDEPWKIIIHPSLHIELSVSGRIDKHIGKKLNKKIARDNTKEYYAEIKKISYSSIIVAYQENGKTKEGLIGVNYLGIVDLKAGFIHEHFKIGEHIKVRKGKFITRFSKWAMYVV